MAPTINPTVHETGRRDWVVVRPYLHRNPKRTGGGGEDSEAGDAYGVKRGDVVTFWKPHKPEEVGIKRIVGVEGDEVRPGRGYVVDAAAEGKENLKGMPDGLADEEVGKVVVPYGHVWLEGDNYHNSLDSRDVGPISKSLVMGKAMWIWRGWGEFIRVGDEGNKREKEMGSRVHERKGGMEVPAVFLE